VSGRVESIGWRVRSGVRLARIVVRVNGTIYRTLRGSARFLKVSFVGRPKQTVRVKVTGVGVHGTRYTVIFTFHTCVSAGEAGVSRVPYLSAG
jgi:hypothetical protein